MGPLFVFWPRQRIRGATPRVTLLTAAAVLVLGCSLAVGIRALAADLRIAFRDAWPSVFTPGDQRQMDTVRAAVPPGVPLLLVARSGDAWHARLWQRGLYPRNTVIVRFEPWDATALQELRRRYPFLHAVSLGDPPRDPGFRRYQDLGPLSGLPAHAWFGELRQ